MHKSYFCSYFLCLLVTIHFVAAFHRCPSNKLSFLTSLESISKRPFSNPSNERRSAPNHTERKKENTEESIVGKEVRLDTGERLQKLIARAGIASRRDAEKMVF